MSKYNPHIHHRRSIRLKGYDYSQAGLYFITICVQNRACLFGEIINGEMILNDAGKIANQCWLEIPNHFPDTILHEHIIMPNHIHGIIESVGANNYSPDNADTSPENADTSPEITANNNGAKNFSPLSSPSKNIGSVVRGFKIGVTKWMRQNTYIYNVCNAIITNTLFAMNNLIEPFRNTLSITHQNGMMINFIQYELGILRR